MKRKPFAVLAVLVVLAATACSSGGGASPGASPSPTPDAQRMLEIGRRLSQCARDHGYPDFPDPEVNGDKLEYLAPSADGKKELDAIAAIPECKTIRDQLRALTNSDIPTPSAADLAKLRTFAQCIRDNGIPDWPDPKADGSFPIIGTPLEAEGQSERFFNALDACKHIYDRRITTS
jgi:hypothetical protein